MMKNPLVQTISKWMFRAYIAWSICADIIVIGGIIYLIFFQGGEIGSTDFEQKSGELSVYLVSVKKTKRKR